MKAKDSSIRGIVANGANIVRKTGYVSFVALGASIGLASKLIDQAYEATKDGYKASTTEPEPEPLTPTFLEGNHPDIDQEMEIFHATYKTEIGEEVEKIKDEINESFDYVDFVYRLYLQHKKGELGW
tara:strand:+ start:254 stop:634 length:381 start_codon:yes stop_codon:yes gene_type:complete